MRDTVTRNSVTAVRGQREIKYPEVKGEGFREKGTEGQEPQGLQEDKDQANSSTEVLTYQKQPHSHPVTHRKEFLQRSGVDSELQEFISK